MFFINRHFFLSCLPKFSLGLLGMLFFLPTGSRGQELPKHQFTIGSSNDSWHGGFTASYDDFRSYSIQLGYQHYDAYSIEANFSHLTNRFAANESDRKVFDEIRVNAVIPVLKKDWLRVSVVPGFVFRGKAFGSAVQDAVHGFFSVEKLNLPFVEENKVHPLAGYQVEATLWKKEALSEHRFSWKIGHALTYVNDYYSQASVSSSFILQNKEHGSISFTPSYFLNNQLLDDNNVLKEVLDVENGVNLRLAVSNGLVTSFFSIYPENDFSSGGISFTLFSGEKKKTTNRIAIISTSLMTKGYGYAMKYKLPGVKLGAEKIKLVINHQYHTLLKKFLINSPSVRGHTNQLTVGGEYEVAELDAWLTIQPYLNLSAGLKSTSIYSREIQVAKQTTYNFAASSDIGLNLFFPEEWSGLSHMVGLTFFYRFNYVNGADTANHLEHINHANSPYEELQSMLGGGLTFSF